MIESHLPPEQQLQHNLSQHPNQYQNSQYFYSEILIILTLKSIINMKQQQKSDQTLNLNYLPRDPELKQQLQEAIQRFRTKLQKQLLAETDKDQQNINFMQQLQTKIQKLDLRLKLTEGPSEELSLLRLDHLDQIFKYYCTHIFKTGNHMTFQRLQYEKIHMTMDRFFLFLRDFEMITMETENGKKQDVIEKTGIITLFKKVSSNSRDLTFKEFMQVIDKLGVMYYDEKQVFYEKKENVRKQKERRKRQYEKKKAQKLHKRKMEQSQKKEDQQENQENRKQQEPQQKNDQSIDKDKNQFPQENDPHLNELSNDQDIDHPNQDTNINQITNRYAFESENQEETPRVKKSNRFQNVNDELFLILTTDQKIQLYYQQVIRIDSISAFKSKVTNLNLKIFQRKQKGPSEKVNTESQPKKLGLNEEERRMEELRKKMQQKKQKKRAVPIPKPKDDDAWAKAEEEKRKKRQLKKQRQKNAKKKNQEESDAVLQKKIDAQKQAKQKLKERQQSYNQNQIDWNMLGKISIDQLKLKQFNPNKYFSKNDDDKTFLDQYEGGRGRIMSGMDMRQRNSIALVEDMKKRVGEVSKKEQKQEKQLENLSKKIGQNIPIKTRFS